MNSRISSIFHSTYLPREITGFPAFRLSDLEINREVDLPIPTHLRLGHLTEKVVAELIRSSTNYDILVENLQVLEDKITVGEIDFIVQHRKSMALIHVEFAYKFYLYDPTISEKPMHNWIGPNRNDTLVEKLDKLRHRQFPILHHQHTKSSLGKIDLQNASQALCFLVSLFIPYDFDGKLEPHFAQAVVGYHMNYHRFNSLDHSGATYFLPIKTQWGMDPSKNSRWFSFSLLQNQLQCAMREKQALLCWKKQGGNHSTFFIHWWPT